MVIIQCILITLFKGEVWNSPTFSLICDVKTAAVISVEMTHEIFTAPTILFQCSFDWASRRSQKEMKIPLPSSRLLAVAVAVALIRRKEA